MSPGIRIWGNGSLMPFLPYPTQIVHSKSIANRQTVSILSIKNIPAIRQSVVLFWVDNRPISENGFTGTMTDREDYTYETI